MNLNRKIYADDTVISAPISHVSRYANRHYALLMNNVYPNYSDISDGSPTSLQRVCVRIYNNDCIKGAQRHIMDNSLPLLICDPPFGLNEGSFGKHYNRKASNVIEGYVEAPTDYYAFTLEWMTEAARVLMAGGTMYIVSSWTNYHHIRNATNALGLTLFNEVIWRFNFGVYTKRKFVTSHYPIACVTKGKALPTTFNRSCRYDGHNKVEVKCSNGKRKKIKLQYADMSDVWWINKEYHSGREKNMNKLPDALVQKMIQYSSNEGDIVCDFFQGNFTTAIVAKSMNRIPWGFEMNKNAFVHGMGRLHSTPWGVLIDLNGRNN